MHGKEELEILLIGWSDFLDGWTVRTRREEGSRRSIVGAHPSQRTRRMGHPQVHGSRGVRAGREIPHSADLVRNDKSFTRVTDEF